MLDRIVQRPEAPEAASTTPASLAEVLRDETLTSGERLQLVEGLFVHDADNDASRGAPSDSARRANRTRPSHAGRQVGRAVTHSGGA